MTIQNVIRWRSVAKFTVTLIQQAGYCPQESSGLFSLMRTHLKHRASVMTPDNGMASHSKGVEEKKEVQFMEENTINKYQICK